MDFLQLFVLHLLFLGCKALCNYPTEIQNKVWIDEKKGRLSYSVSTMAGWSYQLFMDNITEWQCHFRKDHFVVSSSKGVHGMFGQYYRAYLCQNFQKQDNYTYHYYLMSDKNYGERVYLNSKIPDTMCEICSPKNPGPEDSEYYTMSVSSGGTVSAPSVGCNPCLYQCDQPGTPKVTTTTNPILPVFEKGPSSGNSHGDVTEKESSAGTIVGGLIGGFLAIGLVGGILFVLTRRGFCVTNILGSFYEGKKMNSV